MQELYSTLGGFKATLLYGMDVLAGLALIPDHSVHCVVTSPPYRGQRDYRASGQIGDEATWQEYARRLVLVFRALKRVLHPTGTVWLNIGDCAEEMGVAWRVAFALVEDGWHLGQDVVWNKPSPVPDPGLVRCVRAHEFIFMFSLSPKYHYDHVAIEETVENPGKPRKFRDAKDKGATKRQDNGRVYIPKDMRTKRSVWTVANTAFRSPDLGVSHYAAYPPALIEPCVKAGTSVKGCCPQCGAPWIRMTETILKGEIRSTVTTGWVQSCGCPIHMPVPCTVLDPFSGSGTTGVVAWAQKCHYIGIDINPDYERLAAYRLKGNVLREETHDPDMPGVLLGETE